MCDGVKASIQIRYPDRTFYNMKTSKIRRSPNFLEFRNVDGRDLSEMLGRVAILACEPALKQRSQRPPCCSY